MNPSLIFAQTIIMTLVFFLVCSGKAASADENTDRQMPQAIAKQKITVAGTGQQNENLTAFQYSSDLPDRNTIGCVLPLSGRYGDYGNKALDAILFAAGIFNEKNRTSWKIVASDSRGLPEGARNALAHLAKKGNVMAIIAVAGTLEAFEVVQEAGKWKIPIILITPKDGLTKANNYVFQHFLTPPQQIEALVKYAVDDLNCAIFSILYPKDDYGNEMLKLFRAQAARITGKVESAVGYSKSQTDFTEEIKKVTKQDIGSAKETIAGNPEKKAPVALDFEALFIPDSLQRVKMIVSQLAFYDVKNFKLLGTSLWNTPDLLRKDAEYLEGAVFADSFFANGFYPETNDFVDVYYAAYSREPDNIEALSYDTMGMIISVLEDKNITTREQFVAGLQQVKNYRGATGNTSFSADRVSQKTAFILKVKDGKLEQVK
jgi:ABC-type branched-subunit amino acid transport system substrate-binding protein